MYYTASDYIRAYQKARKRGAKAAQRFKADFDKAAERILKGEPEDRVLSRLLSGKE